MKMNRVYQATDRSLIVGVLLASVTITILLIVGRNEVISAIDQVLIIIAGMTTIATLSALEQYRRTNNTSVEIVFNEKFIKESISQGIIEANLINGETKEKLPWDLSSNQLLGVDNSLALAELRIEIERELRRIAYENSIDGTYAVNVVALAEELVSRKVLPAIWLGAMKDIVPICNKAVHGLEASDNLATSVVRVGVRLIEGLRLVSKTGSTSTYIKY